MNDSNMVSGDPLSSLTIAWLGSSVTVGMAAGGYSMADALAEKHPGMTSCKYAISGTTLAVSANRPDAMRDENGADISYVSRLNRLDPAHRYDLFICQLSTNDATKEIPMGEISESRKIEDFDPETVIGAMEYIIAYVLKTWNCPFMFYTGTKFDSKQYEEMVGIVYELQKKWGFGIIDLWNNDKMNAVSEEDYASYMNDPIHPLKKGYVEWWTPVFEAEIGGYLRVETTGSLQFPAINPG